MLLELFVEVLNAVAVVCTLATVGVMLTRRGILSKSVRAGLAEINLNVGIPALLFTRMLDCGQCPKHAQAATHCTACRSTWDDVSQSWILLVSPMVIVGIGLLLGKMLANSYALPDKCRGPAIAAVAFSNATGLPIILLSIIYGSQHEQELMLDPGRYLPNFLIVYPLLQWSIGAWLFGVGCEGSPDDAQTSRSRLPAPTEASISSASAGTCGIELAEIREARAGSAATAASGATTDTWASALSMAMGPRTDTAPLGLGAVAEVAPSAVVAGLRFFVKTFFQPPIAAVMLALFVGVCPCPAFGTLRGLFVDLRDQNNSAPLRWLFQGLCWLAQSVVPVNMLLLGSMLAKGHAFKALPLKVCAAVVVCKMVLLPSIVWLLVQALRPVLLQEEDPRALNSMWFVVLICSATPTASNMQVLAMLGNQNAEALAALMLMQYLCAPALLTGSLLVFLASMPDVGGHFSAQVL